MTARVTGSRPCRGIACAALLPRGRREPRYCHSCLAQRCRECARFGGRHGKQCRWITRRHRRSPITYKQTTVDDVERVYVTSSARARRVAARYVPWDQAGDAVQVAAEYLLRRHEIYPGITPTLFCRLAGWAALRMAQRQRSWLTFAGDVTDLVRLEHLDRERWQRFQHEFVDADA